MSNPPPFEQPPIASYASAVRDPSVVDGEHLRILAICHYIWAGLLAAFACFGLFYIALGIAAMSGQLGPSVPSTMPSGAQNADRFLGIVFICMGGFITLAGWTVAILNVIAGRSCSRHRRRLFIFAIAIVNCLFFPFGTTLGVFTLIVLLRDSVRVAFDPTSRVAEAA